jgi:hypothetical protein
VITSEEGGEKMFKTRVDLNASLNSPLMGVRINIEDMIKTYAIMQEITIENNKPLKQRIHELLDAKKLGTVNFLIALALITDKTNTHTIELTNGGKIIGHNALIANVSGIEIAEAIYIGYMSKLFPDNPVLDGEVAEFDKICDKIEGTEDKVEASENRNDKIKKRFRKKREEIVQLGDTILSRLFTTNVKDFSAEDLRNMIKGEKDNGDE